MATSRTPPPRFDPTRLYDRFPSGDRHGYGPGAGFNTYRRINDPSLFTPAALEDPVIQAFVNAPFSVSFAQFKSSTRESEWALHMPHRTMAGRVRGVEGRVENFPEDPEKVRIATLLMNHERTMARYKQMLIVLEDGLQAGQLVYKDHDGSQEDPEFGAEAADWLDEHGVPPADDDAEAEAPAL